jgi:hypothetical protein
MKREETELADKKEHNRKTRGGDNPSAQAAEQVTLWPIEPPSVPKPTARGNETTVSVTSADIESHPPRQVGARRQKGVIQDLLVSEGLLAAKLSLDAISLDDFQRKLETNLRQNSSETRQRYAQSILKWFFPDGLDGLARKVWTAYHDDRIESDILRHLYLSSEPIMGACVADALFPLQEGIIIPAGYFDRFLKDYLNAEPPPKTRERVKMNLVKLGFLKPARGAGHRLNPITQTKTAFFVLLHHLFAPVQPRTIELRHLFANPFWKYLGFKSEDAVRGVIREANALGLLGKYVVADELEQITSCLSLADILDRGVRL